MGKLSMAEVRKGFAGVIGRVEGSKERMVITRHGKPVAALVPMHDAVLLEKLEDHLDVVEAMEFIEDYESAGGVSLRQVKADLGY